MQLVTGSPLRALIAMILIAASLMTACTPESDSKAKLLKEFSDSVSRNKALPEIISWARSLLADTNNASGQERVPISKDEFPKGLFGLYRGPNAGVTTPSVCICSPKGEDRFVAVNFLPGSVLRFSVFIGGEGFNIPENRVRMWTRLEDGVFVALDWP